MTEHRRKLRRRATAVRIAILAGALSVLLPARIAIAHCTPTFPYSNGWLGGDVAGSIPLSSGRVLWLFGDSFVGSHAQRSRSGSRMVSNSVAISTCTNSKWNIQYYFHNHSASPMAFFDSRTTKYRYWPLDGFLFRGSLYIFLVEIVTTGSGLFDFKETGVKLARVSNPGAEPSRWAIEYRDLVSGSAIVPGVSAVVAPPWAYLYATIERGASSSHEIILTRISLERLKAPSAALEYLAHDGTWKIGQRWDDARVIVSPGTPDFSVRYHPAIGRWVMVQTDPGFPAKHIGIRTAERLEGPWSEFRPRFDIPEAADSERDRGLFCYAAKEHPEFASSAATLSVTYACNASSFQKLVEDMSIYRPRAIAITLP